MDEEIERRVTGFLGLCTRAGTLVSGQEPCVENIRSQRARIALLDAAASENTRKRVTDACHTHGVPLYELSAGALGHSIGKGGRMTAVLGEGGMADKLLRLLQSEPRL